MGKLFGTNGIRGKFGDELTVELAVKIALSIGTYFNGGEILVGFDGRVSSPILKRAVISGLLASGCNVAHAGMLPTPVLQFGVKYFKYDGGVMITASHNPPEYNGIKVIGPDGIEIPRREEEKIEEVFFENKIHRAAWNEVGRIKEEPNVIQAYIDEIIKQVNVRKIASRKFKVVVDPGNGVSSLTTPIVLKRIGCEVITINDVIDGKFPGRGPEPIPKVLGIVSKMVSSSNADLGVSLDGDGDRAIFTDEKGVTHWGDKSGAIIEKYLLQREGGGIIVTPVSSSKLIEEIAMKYNGEIIWTRVGSVTVSHKLKEVNGTLGIEENGGIFYPPHQLVRDGTMATLLMLEVLTHEGEGLSKIVDKLPRYYNYKDKIPCPHNLKKKVMEKMLLEVKCEEAVKIETIDGIKIWKDENKWVLIRPSGTEPIIRIYAEAKSNEEAKELVEKYKEKLRGILA
ncbi:MAG: phosphoglucosamine mutase [archaeon GB-1867-035]|nr:phosphoglucosamine mutase [Candidatus Culexmicrobium profundum]